jgi:flavin reductase (DIM6/NTAB) family NADH-FMN oxidoreductase RutF
MMNVFREYWRPEAMAIDAEALRQAMRYWSTGITIISAEFDQIKHGMTVSSFTSVSLDPPLVLVSLEQTTRTHDLVDKAQIFGVAVLGSHQKEISDRFAGRQTEFTDRFAGLEVRTLVTGAPLLLDNLACFDCRVVRQIPIGNHTIFIGEVLALNVSDGSISPLVYFNRAYYRLQE